MKSRLISDIINFKFSSLATDTGHFSFSVNSVMIYILNNLFHLTDTGHLSFSVNLCI